MYHSTATQRRGDRPNTTNYKRGSFERSSQAANSPPNLRLRQWCVPEDDAGALWRLYLERLYTVQPHTGFLCFAMHVRDHPTATSFQPNKKMESGIRTANLRSIAKFLANGGH